jgi:hypothetical protein
MTGPGVKPTTFTVEPSNKRVVEELCRSTSDPFFVNGLRYEPGDEAPISERDQVVVTVPSVVDQLASLDERPTPDPYIVVACVDRNHRRVNDLLVPDPGCRTCLGLGIVRVLREHVPVVHRKDDKWERGDDAVSRLADLSGPPT